MGAQNVGLVYARWGALNHAPFRVLAYMALRSLDSGNPPIYYAGRDEIAMALGRQIPEPGPDFERSRKADWAMAKKVVRELTQAGAIILNTPASTGQNAVYELNIRGIDKSYPQGTGGTSSPPSGGTSGNRLVVPQVSTGGTSGTPLGVQGVLGVVVRTDGEGDQQAAGSARASAEETQESSSELKDAPKSAAIPGPDCTGCGTLLDPDGSCFVCRTPGKRTTPEYTGGIR